MKKITETKGFRNFVKRFWKKNEKPFVFGIRQGIHDSNGNLIAVKWLTMNVNENLGTAAVLMDADENMTAATIVEMYFESFLGDGNHYANIAALQFIGDNYPVIYFCMHEDELTKQKPIDHLDVHFRHALMSRRYYQPNMLNFDGASDLMPNLAWTNTYAYSIEDYNKSWFTIQANGEFFLCQDKFPPMYWVNPTLADVRAANTLMLRNGAYLVELNELSHNNKTML